MIMGSELHIIPVGDEHEHTRTRDCPCRPVVVDQVAYDLVIHAAWDCREVVEVAEDIAPGILHSTGDGSPWELVWA